MNLHIQVPSDFYFKNKTEVMKSRSRTYAKLPTLKKVCSWVLRQCSSVNVHPLGVVRNAEVWVPPTQTCWIRMRVLTRSLGDSYIWQSCWRGSYGDLEHPQTMSTSHSLSNGVSHKASATESSDNLIQTLSISGSLFLGSLSERIWVNAPHRITELWQCSSHLTV